MSESDFINQEIFSVCKSINKLQQFRLDWQEGIVTTIRLIYNRYMTKKYKEVLVPENYVCIIYSNEKYILPPGKWIVSKYDSVHMIRIVGNWYEFYINKVTIQIYITYLNIRKYIQYIYLFPNYGLHIYDRIESYLKCKRYSNIEDIETHLNTAFDDFEMKFSVKIIL